MKQIFNLLFGHWIETIRHCIPIIKGGFTLLLNSLLLWCVNFVIPFSFIFLSPIFLRELSDFPKFVYELLYTWLVDGFRFQLVFYFMCFLINLSNYEKRV